MRIKLLILLAFVLVHTYGETPIGELAIKLLKAPELERKASQIITGDQRVELIEFLRDARDRHTYFGGGADPEILLINLGDEEQIQMLIEDLRSSNPLVSRRASSSLGLSSQVSVIPYLAEYIYNEEPSIFQLYQDVDIICLSVRSSQAILSILSRSPDVSDEVREWAKKQDYRVFGPAAAQCRTVVRSWWPQNKRFFETGEYGKIRPLGDDALGESVIEVEPSRSAVESDMGESPAAAPESPVPLIHDHGKTFDPWKVVVPILVVSGGLFFAFFRFRRR